MIPMQNRVFILCLFLFLPTLGLAGDSECVILLHGLGRTHSSMSILESALRKAHYFVVNKNYPSTRKLIPVLANEYIPPMIAECVRHHKKQIHFVTHSLGGIVLQYYLKDHAIAGLKTIVMLAPPNHGSKLADQLHNQWYTRFLLGPVVKELTTQKKNIHLRAGQYKIGIIAGNFSFNPFANRIFGEPNDGKVAVSSTRMDQMSDFIVLPVSHTFMMNNVVVLKQILYFLAHGQFLRA